MQYANQKNVTLDLTGKTVTEEIRYDGGESITVIGGELASLNAGYGYGLRFLNVKNITIRGVKAHDHRAGMTFTNCENIIVEDSEFWGMGADGLSFAECSGIAVRRNMFRDFKHTELSHPDAIQFVKGTLGNRKVRVEKNAIIGHMQGIFGQLEDGVVARNLLRTGFQAINLMGRGVLELMYNTVSTLEGAPYQARITVQSGYASVTRRANTVDGYAGKPAQNDPA